ncbi:hypothetical protein D3C87_2084180 [compost metagenome]
MQTNEDAVTHGRRVLSVYRLPLRDAASKDSTVEEAGEVDELDNRIWLITEADRSVTTLLLPEEY